jgi:PRTRC genetic system protein A
MLPNPVSYLIYHGEELALPAGKAYAYYMAGNGIWKLAQNQHVLALVQLARCRVAGLPDLEQRIELAAGRIDGALLTAILRDARHEAWAKPKEAMYHLRFEGAQFSVTKPRQSGGAGHLSYEGGDDAAVICDLHSHHEMSAFYSSTDNRDEQGLRFYGVIGRIFTRPEIRLRLGVHGFHVAVPVTLLFTECTGLRDLKGESWR